MTRQYIVFCYVNALTHMLNTTFHKWVVEQECELPKEKIWSAVSVLFSKSNEKMLYISLLQLKAMMATTSF